MLVDIYCHTHKGVGVRKILLQRKIEILPRQIANCDTLMVRCKRKDMQEIELIPGVQCTAWAEEPEDVIVCVKCGHKMEV